MHLARYTLAPTFSVYITALFASVFLLVIIKDEPLRGSRKSHFSSLQESLRLAEHSFPVGLSSSLRERHFRYNAVKHPHSAVTAAKPSTRTVFVFLVPFGYLTFQTCSLNLALRSLIHKSIFTILKVLKKAQDASCLFCPNWNSE